VAAEPGYALQKANLSSLGARRPCCADSRRAAASARAATTPAGRLYSKIKLLKSSGVAHLEPAYHGEKRILRQREKPMNRKLILALIALPLLLSTLGGCVVYERDGGYYHHYWHDRY
jgi:hypothetical protein